jgi:hypothetical protein
MREGSCRRRGGGGCTPLLGLAAGAMRGDDDVVFRGAEGGDAGGEGGVVPVRECVDGFSWVSGWIGLGRKPFPSLPNTFFGLQGNSPPAWAEFRLTRVFGPIPPQTLTSQTRPHGRDSTRACQSEPYLVVRKFCLFNTLEQKVNFDLL